MLLTVCFKYNEHGKRTKKNAQASESSSKLFFGILIFKMLIHSKLQNIFYY